MFFRLRLTSLFLTAFLSSVLCAQSSVQSSPAEELAALVARQKPLLEKAAGAQSAVALEDLRPQLQKLAFDYDAFLARHPDFAAGYVSYGLFLNQPAIDERKQAANQFLRANQLDPDIPLVKNQLGNYLAEEGRPLEALHFYLEAVALSPEEPLYHVQIGTLLVEARASFLQSAEWSREKLDAAMLDAFARAAKLAPDRLDLSYRYGMAFYDLDLPQWQKALDVWTQLEARTQLDRDRQLIRLHEANVLGKLGQQAKALELLDSVDEPIFATQKRKLREALTAKSDGAPANTPSANAPPAASFLEMPSAGLH